MSGPTKARRVYEALRDDVLEGRAAPGSVLDEVEIAAAFAVSRTPVREALRLLQSDGLLETGARRQLRVAEVSEVRRREVSVVRAALEAAAVDDVLRLRTEDDVDRLRLSVVKQRRAADADDAQRFFELDEEFHRTLVAVAGMPMLAALLDQLGAFVRLTRFGLPTDAAHLTGLAAEHDTLLDLLEAGDPDRLRAALVAHITRTDDRDGAAD
ncbi:GntR family transcriptional regulator [Patulibacter sp.]|uniref:GntR family transcriptional regulator n=1 Tax=Patulibacter sp. TaxID=1912859 RepID=UPI002719D9DA|nr:GntR family transcriptional regulator [Patulibacter sp.]MDO9408873.1 GntR family transcriptional regulator [Patulibacter sp.]